MQTLAILVTFLYLGTASILLWKIAGAIVSGKVRLSATSIVVTMLGVLFWPAMIAVLVYDAMICRHQNVRSRRVM